MAAADAMAAAVATRMSGAEAAITAAGATVVAAAVVAAASALGWAAAAGGGGVVAAAEATGAGVTTVGTGAVGRTELRFRRTKLSSRQGCHLRDLLGVERLRASRPSVAVLLFHGSEGGFVGYMDSVAHFFRSHGIPAQTYCWYRCTRDASPTLENVELERVISAVEATRAKYGRVVLYGFSRGSELALLLSTKTKIDGLVLHSATDQVSTTFNPTWPKSCDYCPENATCLRDNDFKWNPRCGRSPASYYGNPWTLNGHPVLPGTPIDVSFSGPTLIFVGDKDKKWSPKLTENVQRAREDLGEPVEVLHFPTQGHVFNGANWSYELRVALQFLKENFK